MGKSMTCHWCRLADATGTLDGHAACDACLTPVADPPQPPTLAYRIFRAIYFNPGSTASDLCELMCIETEHYLVWNQLRRLKLSGAVRCERSRDGVGYYAVDEARIPVSRVKGRSESDSEFLSRNGTSRDEARPGGCRYCGAGLLPEWRGVCPECRDRIETKRRGSNLVRVNRDLARNARAVERRKRMNTAKRNEAA